MGGPVIGQHDQHAQQQAGGRPAAGARTDQQQLDIPDLIAVGIPDLVTGAGYPSTPTCVVPVWRITGIG